MANCVLFFMAAYETTASTMGFLLYNLALNPECQETLVEEIDNVVGETVSHHPQSLLIRIVILCIASQPFPWHISVLFDHSILGSRYRLASKSPKKKHLA